MHRDSDESRQRIKSPTVDLSNQTHQYCRKRSGPLTARINGPNKILAFFHTNNLTDRFLHAKWNTFLF